MNRLQTKIIDVLKDLKENHGVYGVKSEFEAEGTRVEELFRLRDIANLVNLNFTIKIGGCLALRDLFTSKLFNADFIVSPMIESPFALHNYIEIINKVYTDEEQGYTKFLINIETIKAVNSIDLIMSVPNVNKINGIVLGRSDLVGSMNLLDKKAVDSEEVYQLGYKVFKKAKELSMTTIIGGTITKNSITVLNNYYSNNLLDKFETRKVCFKLSEALNSDIEKGIEKAIYFELLWLEYKRNYYKRIYNEDKKRIIDLRKRSNYKNLK